MSLPRFHCPLPLAPHTRIALPEALAHHAVRVLRLRHGAPIILFNGEGGQYTAELEVQGREAWARLGEHSDTERELPVRTILVQGIAAADKMDWITEKAVEMGVTQLVPIAARRSVVQLAGERREKRLQHWRRIAIAASEQCGRNRIMGVAPPQTLEQWLAQPAREGLLRLTCDPDAQAGLGETVARHSGPLALLVGPEGGWSDDELALMREHGLTAVRFGRRVLRTETAGIALMAALAALRGWE